MADYNQRILQEVRSQYRHLGRRDSDIIAFNCQEYVKAGKDAPRKFAEVLNSLSALDPRHSHTRLIGDLDKWRRRFNKDDNGGVLEYLVELGVYGVMTEKLIAMLEPCLKGRKLFYNRSMYFNSPFGMLRPAEETNLFSALVHWNMDFHKQTEPYTISENEVREEV